MISHSPDGTRGTTLTVVGKPTPAPTTSPLRRPLACLLAFIMIPIAGVLAVPQIAAATSPTITSAPPSSSTSRDATFEFTGTGALECELDFFGYQPCTDTITYTGLVNGTHRFAIRPIADPNNTTIYTWTIDDGTPNQTRTWYLNNLQFDSGATATGSFDYNPQPYNPVTGQYGTYSNINITVTATNGTTRQFGIVNPASSGNSRYVSIVAATGGDLTGAPFMALTPATDMTTSGGTINILPGPQNLSYLGVCLNTNCGPAGPPFEEAQPGGQLSTAPAPTITTPPAVSAAENQTAVVDLDATDPDGDTEGSGLVYSITGGADQAAFGVDSNTGVVTFGVAPDFENPTDSGGDNVYNMTVTVTDSTGGVDSIDLVVTVTDVVEDETPPVAAPTQSPPANAVGWNNANVTVTWNWTDGESGIDLANCITSSGTGGDGVIELNASCSDLAGNTGEAAVIVRVDTAAPTATITSTPPATATTDAATFEFTATDTGSGVARIECQVDNGGFSPCTSPLSVTGLQNGEHNFEVRTVDRADNISPTAAYSWTVERTLLCNGLVVTVNLAAGDVPTAGDDVILGTAGVDVINAGDGNDTICAGAGNDRVQGQNGDDTIFGGGDNDVLAGNAGNDMLHGQGGADSIFGGSGNDTITGAFGNDLLGGGSDTDTITGDQGNDTITGGSGNDGLISGGDGNDAVNGGGDDDNNVNGDAGNDTVSGNGGKDTVNGGDGDDQVRGGQNDDIVNGGPGNDFLAGNTGIDTCDGGPGTDTTAPNCETILNVP
jgi:Ca2+-binding RTX toxin-like protein